MTTRPMTPGERHLLEALADHAAELWAAGRAESADGIANVAFMLRRDREYVDAPTPTERQSDHREADR